MTNVLEVIDVEKRFGAVRALEKISLHVNAGEIVALLGDNGAGKSTLMNIICGSNAPNAGEVRVHGEPLDSLAAAQRLGVGVVYQDLALAAHLSVAENLFLGEEITESRWWLKILKRKKMKVQARQAIGDLGISTLRNVGMPVGKLSGGQRQVLAVARAMRRASSFILLDEPTAALGPKQAEHVLEVIRNAAKRGIGVVLVSHDIPSVLKLADRLIILRHGNIVLDSPPQGMTVADVMTAMVGEG